MKVTVINFTVTYEGLSEQLLVEIVRLENAEIEAKRAQITQALVND
jgi:dynein heavy chain